MEVQVIKPNKKKSPYSFETYLNGMGHTVVYLKRGKHKVWLFNMSDNEGIDFSVHPSDAEKQYQKLELPYIKDDYGETVPLVTGLNMESKLVADKLDEITDRLDKIFNI